MHTFENHIVVMGNCDGGYSRVVVQMIVSGIQRGKLGQDDPIKALCK